MHVFLIGGTGLLGSAAAAELIRRGHTVTSIALPPLPAGATLPEQMTLIFGNYLDLTDAEIRRHLSGCDGFVFAAGVDERVEAPAPVYELFRTVNITPLARWLRIAKACGVRQAVICGSYFAYFARIWPDLHLTKHHPYIRSRVDQADLALSFADDQFNVAVLELPYIFGAQPGRKPVWVFLVKQIRAMWPATFYPRGGTAMVTVRQVGQCIAGALEHHQGGRNYPIGMANLEWRELLTIIHKHMGLPGRRVITIPDWLFAWYAGQVKRRQQRSGIEGGLDLAFFARVMCAKTFIEPSAGAACLGAQSDDIDAAIGESVRLCLAVLDNKTAVIGMQYGDTPADPK